MFHKLILLIALFSFTGIAHSQQDSIRKPQLKLLYYVDVTNNAPTFLIPFIETYLKDLAYAEKQPQFVFSEVISLNMLFENRKIEGKIIDAFVYADRKQTTLSNSKERDQRDAQVSNSLLNYDRFLVIKITPFNSQLEYQFLMYDVVKSSDPKIKDSPVLVSYRSSSVFIVPQSTTYKEEIEFAIKQICPEVNETPQAKIKADSKIPREASDTVYIAVGDTIDIAALAIDPDSPKERFAYTWILSDNSLYGQIAYGKAKQKLFSDTSMAVNVGLTIGDGISISPQCDIVIAWIYPPEIKMVLGGNAVFVYDEDWNIFSGNLNEILDSAKPREDYECDFIYRKNLFGKKKLLFEEDSLFIYYSKGNLRLGYTTVSDSVLTADIRTETLLEDAAVYNIPEDTNSSKTELKKGNYGIIHIYPKEELRPSHYYYSFYAEKNGVKSQNLNVRVNLIKISQFSLFNENYFTWMGAKKGSMGTTFLGVSWQPFFFIHIHYGATYFFWPSHRITDRVGDRIEMKTITSRLILEFMGKQSMGMSAFSIQMQSFNVENTDGGKRKDNVWGIGSRATLPLVVFGFNFSPTLGFNYFPNFKKKTYISGVGIFEGFIGMRYTFIRRK